MERREGLVEECAQGQQTCDGDGDGPAEAGEHGVQTDDHDCMRFTRGLRPTVVAAAPRQTIDLRLSPHNPPHLITLRPPSVTRTSKPTQQLAETETDNATGVTNAGSRTLLSIFHMIRGQYNIFLIFHIFDS